MDAHAITTSEQLKLGAVSYLNSKPLVYGIREALPEASIRYDLPSRLADDLSAGRLHVALVPIVEYLRHPQFRLVSSACVACRGPVLSVKLFFRKPPQDVKRLALDEGSRTSAALAQILLHELHQVRPELTALPIGHRMNETDADAVLLIGDRAIQAQDEPFCEVWDLGDRWCRWSELPFVFAAWVARPDLPVTIGELAATLEQVRDQGLANVDAIVESEADKLALDHQVARDYLTHNLHFNLSNSELRGMERFANLCRELGLVSSSLPNLSLSTT